MTGTVKKHKAWYICEGFHLCGCYVPKKGKDPNRIVHPLLGFDADSDDYRIWVPEFRDRYNSPCPSVAFNPYGELNTDPYTPDYPSDYRYMFDFEHSNMFATITSDTVNYYLTKDTLNNWSFDDWQVLNYEDDIKTIVISNIFDPAHFGRLINICGYNDRDTPQTISCLRMTKCAFDAYDEHGRNNNTTTGNALRLEKHPGMTEALYLSYYFDTPVTLNPGESKTFSFFIRPDDIASYDNRVKKMSGWKSTEIIRMGDIRMFATDRLGCTHMGTADNPRNYYKFKTNPYIARVMPTGTGTFSSIPAVTEYAYGPAPYIEAVNQQSVIHEGLKTRFTDIRIMDYLGIAHNFTTILVTQDDIQDHTENSFSDVFMTSAASNHPELIGVEYLSSIWVCDSEKIFVHFTLTLMNDNYPNGFTAKCLQFMKARWETEYRVTNGSTSRTDLLEDPHRDLYEGNDRVLIPYIYYYLPNPVFIPYGETRVIDIKVYPDCVEML